MTEEKEQSKAGAFFDRLKAAFDHIEQEVVVLPLSEDGVQVEEESGAQAPGETDESSHERN